ncbi:hypothetical protein DSLASN_25030 [Desulfoluna limicola]|uniref:Uncharacterized protein n=1 Tax=Desulfoluna limicola TaxID=2810562 RepID=A0ABM7PI86_9BACT|nr:hypothetical protein DSLASN_25030 [Desulfoluna limicola]
MGGCHQIDVLTSHLLNREHHSSQGPVIHLMPFHVMADLPILAEKAPQVASGKKEGSRPPCSHKAGFFAIVRAIRRQDRPRTDPAEAPLPAGAIHTATTGTESAG